MDLAGHVQGVGEEDVGVGLGVAVKLHLQADAGRGLLHRQAHDLLGRLPGGFARRPPQHADGGDPAVHHLHLELRGAEGLPVLPGGLDPPQGAAGDRRVRPGQLPPGGDHGHAGLLAAVDQMAREVRVVEVVQDQVGRPEPFRQVRREVLLRAVHDRGKGAVHVDDLQFQVGAQARHGPHLPLPHLVPLEDQDPLSQASPPTAGPGRPRGCGARSRGPGRRPSPAP